MLSDRVAKRAANGSQQGAGTEKCHGQCEDFVEANA